MKEVLISIQPERVGKIINGEMSIIVQKTRPKIETPLKCYICCTKGENLWLTQKGVKSKTELAGYLLNEKVVAEFILNEVDFIKMPTNLPQEFLEKACVSGSELMKYLGGDFYKSFYAWHIDSLKIYDKPKELSKFYKPFKYDGDGIICGTEKEMDNIYEWDCETLFKDRYPDFKFENCKCKNCPKAKDFYRLTRPPKSWLYVEKNEEE